MSDENSEEGMDLKDFGEDDASEIPTENGSADDDPLNFDESQRSASDLEAVFEIPVNIQAVLGRTNMEVRQILELDTGDVIELDRKVGEAIDIYVNNRLVARGEVVIVDERLGVTMTEIIKGE